LYRNGTQELIGSIDLDPAVRAPRHNGARDAKILLEVACIFSPGSELDGHVDACAVRIRRALERLPELRHYAVDHAPPEWVRQGAAEPGPPLIERLFLDGIEVSPLLRVSLAFDFGDLDMLMVLLDDKEDGQQVSLRTIPHRQP